MGDKTMLDVLEGCNYRLGGECSQCLLDTKCPIRKTINSCPANAPEQIAEKDKRIAQLGALLRRAERDIDRAFDLFSWGYRDDAELVIEVLETAIEEAVGRDSTAAGGGEE